jgi:hypothetical protein
MLRERLRLLFDEIMLSKRNVCRKLKLKRTSLVAPGVEPNLRESTLVLPREAESSNLGWYNLNQSPEKKRFNANDVSKRRLLTIASSKWEHGQYATYRRNRRRIYRWLCRFKIHEPKEEKTPLNEIMSDFKFSIWDLQIKTHYNYRTRTQTYEIPFYEKASQLQLRGSIGRAYAAGNS